MARGWHLSLDGEAGEARVRGAWRAAMVRLERAIVTNCSPRVF